MANAERGHHNESHKHGRGVFTLGGVVRAGLAEVSKDRALATLPWGTPGRAGSRDQEVWLRGGRMGQWEKGPRGGVARLHGLVVPAGSGQEGEQAERRLGTPMRRQEKQLGLDVPW